MAHLNAGRDESFDLVIVGGGLCGCFAAAFLKLEVPGARVAMVEREPEVMMVSSRWRPDALLVPEPLSFEDMIVPAPGLFPPPGAEACSESLRSALGRCGIELSRTIFNEKPVWTAPWSTLRTRLRELLENTGTVWETGEAADDFGRVGDAGFRVWRNEGPPIDGKHLMLATGAVRPRLREQLSGLGLASEETQPGHVRLRVRGTRWRKFDGKLLSQVRVQLDGRPAQVVGDIDFEGATLGGSAVEDLLAADQAWASSKSYRLTVVGDLTGGRHGDLSHRLAQIQSHRGSRNVGGSPEFGLDAQLWYQVLEMSGIRPDRKWVALKKPELRKLRKNLGQVTWESVGMRESRTEKSSVGGVPVDEIEPESGQSKKLRGLYLAGEMLQFVGRQGGQHTACCLVTALRVAESVKNQLKK